MGSNLLQKILVTWPQEVKVLRLLKLEFGASHIFVIRPVEKRTTQINQNKDPELTAAAVLQSLQKLSNFR